jgi:thiol-disulfide isomerase/thioredoxin
MKVVSIGPNDSSKFDNELSIRPAFVKFYHPTCIHCQNMKEAWDSLGEVMMNDDRDMSIIEVHADSIGDIKANVAKNVNGYPTVMMVYKDGNKFKNYEGGRSVSDMKKFINDNFKETNSMSGGSKKRYKSKARKSKSKLRKSKARKSKSKSRKSKSRKSKSRKSKSRK